MKNVFLITLLLVNLVSYGQKTITQLNQTITWQGKAAVGDYAPEGTLEIKKIELLMVNDTIKSMTITINMKSLSQENKQLTKHLKGKDFFDVKKYPEASFNLTNEFVIGKTEAMVGEMTIKNKSQTEEITIDINKDNTILKLSFNHKMNRLDYGITYNSPTVFEKLKDNAISDDIRLKGVLTISVK